MITIAAISTLAGCLAALPPQIQGANPHDSFDDPERIVAYDVGSGQAVRHAAGNSSASDLPAQFVAARGLRNASPEPYADPWHTTVDPWNSGLVRIYDQSYPWSTQCRIEYTRDGNTYTASGTLIDFNHVITAGSVVHGGQGSGWSTSITVHPAWDGDADAYGSASGAYFYSFNGWIQSNSQEHNMGLIRLNRPVGALTGHLGYGYNTSDPWYQNTTFNLAGYPNQNYQGSPNALHYGSGTFHNVAANTLNSTTNWTASAAGIEGGGAYWIDNGSRIVSATASHHSFVLGAWRLIATRMNSSKFTFFRDTAIPEGYPDRANLMPLNCRLTTVGRGGTVQPGQQLGWRCQLFNAARQDSPAPPFGQSFPLYSWRTRVYLSTNDYISTSDQLLLDLNSHGNPGARLPAHWSTTAGAGYDITIPASTGPGTYWIGVLVDCSAYQYGSGTNRTTSWDSYPVKIEGPTLTVVNLASGSTAQIGFAGTPGALCLVNWSATGGGPTPTPFGNLLLTPPYFPVLWAGLGASGNATTQVPIPAGFRGTPLWFDGAEILNNSLTWSNPLAVVVQ